jgi:hypothetical protein
MADQSQSKKEKEDATEEIRFKYIGFDVYPKKPKRFWKNEEEKERYLTKARQKGIGSALEESEHSLVQAVAFSKIDRVVLTLASLLMTVGFFLPWFSLTGEYYNFRVIGLGYFLKLGDLFGYAGLSGPMFSIFVILVGLVIICSFVCGVLSLVGLYKKQPDDEKYLAGLKKMLKLNLIPLALWVALIVISTIGFSTPFADALKVNGFGDGFTVVNFFMLSSYGMWLSLPSVIINCVKIGDL